MQTKGTFKQTAGYQEGTSAKGAWKKCVAVFEIANGQFTENVAFTCFGNMADNAASLKAGNRYVIDFDIKSREYNGKWYTDVNAWRFAEDDEQPVQQPAPAPKRKAVQTTIGIVPPSFTDDDPTADLPF